MANSIPMKYAIQTGQSIQVMGGIETASDVPSKTGNNSSSRIAENNSRTYINSDGSVSSTQKRNIKTEKNVYTLEQTVTLRRDDSSQEPQVVTNTEINGVRVEQMGGETNSGVLLQNILAGLRDSNQPGTSALVPGVNADSRGGSTKPSSVDSGIESSQKSSGFSSQGLPPRVSSSAQQDQRETSRAESRSGGMVSAGTRSNKSSRRISFDSSSFRGSTKHVNSVKSVDSSAGSRNIRAMLSQEVSVAREGLRPVEFKAPTSPQQIEPTKETKSKEMKSEVSGSNAEPVIAINVHDPSEDTASKESKESKKKKQKYISSSGTKNPKSDRQSESPECKAKAREKSGQGRSRVRSHKASNKTKSKITMGSTELDDLLTATHPLPAHLQKIQKKGKKDYDIFGTTSTETRRTPFPCTASASEKPQTRAAEKLEAKSKMRDEMLSPATKLSTLTESKGSQNFTSLDVKQSDGKGNALITDDPRNSSIPKEKPWTVVDTTALGKQYSAYNERKLGSMAYRDTAVSRDGVLPGRESETVPQQTNEKQTPQIMPIDEGSEKSGSQEKFQGFSLVVSESINPSTVSGSKNKRSKKSSNRTSATEYYSEYTTEGGESGTTSEKTPIPASVGTTIRKAPIPGIVSTTATKTSSAVSSGMASVEEKIQSEKLETSNTEGMSQKSGKSKTSGNRRSASKRSDAKLSKREFGSDQRSAESDTFQAETTYVSKPKNKRQKSLPSEDPSQSKLESKCESTASTTKVAWKLSGGSAATPLENSQKASGSGSFVVGGQNVTTEGEDIRSPKTGKKRSKRSKSPSSYDESYLTPDPTMSRSAKSSSRRKHRKESNDGSQTATRKSKESKRSKLLTFPTASENYSQTSRDDGIGQSLSKPEAEVMEKSLEEQNHSEAMKSFSTGKSLKSTSKKSKSNSREHRKSNNKSSRSSKIKSTDEPPEDIPGADRFFIPVSKASERPPTQSSRTESSLSLKKREGVSKKGGFEGSSFYYYYDSNLSSSAEEEEMRVELSNAKTGSGAAPEAAIVVEPQPPHFVSEDSTEAVVEDEELENERAAAENDDVKNSNEESDRTYNVETPAAAQKINASSSASEPVQTVSATSLVKTGSVASCLKSGSSVMYTVGTGSVTNMSAKSASSTAKLGSETTPIKTSSEASLARTVSEATSSASPAEPASPSRTPLQPPPGSLEESLENVSMEYQYLPHSRTTLSKSNCSHSADVIKENSQTIMKESGEEIAEEEEEQHDYVENERMVVQKYSSAVPQHEEVDQENEEQVPPEIPPRAPIESAVKSLEPEEKLRKSSRKQKSHNSGERKSKKTKRSKSKHSEMEGSAVSISLFYFPLKYFAKRKF